MTALILQARLDSSRLPKKALLPLGGEPMILRVMENLKGAKADAYVLACPPDAESAFAPLAERAGFSLVLGSKEDVLSRYVKASRFIDADCIIRCTGDNPFVFTDALDSIVQEALLLQSDYASYSGLPYGVGVEVIKAQALYRADAEAQSPYEREHVCPYLYAHGELFLLHRPLAPLPLRSPALRLTVDTREDYERALTLYASGTTGESVRILAAARSLGLVTTRDEGVLHG